MRGVITSDATQNSPARGDPTAKAVHWYRYFPPALDRAKSAGSFRNAIFHLADNDLSLRVYGSQEDPTRAARTVSLSGADFSAVRNAPVLSAQPVRYLGYQASV